MPRILREIVEDRLIPGPQVEKRYGVSGMTIRRWQKRSDLGFPEVVVIAGRRYWYVGELAAWERRLAGRAV